jgi:hypothetical protein
MKRALRAKKNVPEMDSGQEIDKELFLSQETEHSREQGVTLDHLKTQHPGFNEA